MTLDTLSATLTTLREEADTVRAVHVAKIRSIDANERMTMLAKREEVSAVREATRAKLADLERREDAAVAAERIALKRRISGTASDDPSHVIAFRDAYDRAGAITDRTAARDAMTRALDLADTTLAQAVLHRSVEMGFDDAINLYTAAHPDAQIAIRDLTRLTEFAGSTEEQFAKYTTYMLPNADVHQLYEGLFANGRIYPETA